MLTPSHRTQAQARRRPDEATNMECCHALPVAVSSSSQLAFHSHSHLHPHLLPTTYKTSIDQRVDCGTETPTSATVTAAATASPPASQTRQSHSQAPDSINPRPARRKLRKNAPRPKALQLVGLGLGLGKRGSRDSSSTIPTPTTAASSPASAALECGGSLATPQFPNCERPSIPMPTDLSDSKWLDYIESSGLMSSTDLPLGLGSRTKVVTEPTISSSMIPDLSSLSLQRSSSRQSSRDSSSSFKFPVMSRPRKSISKRSLLAPSFKIGQLDGTAPRRKEIRVIKRKASIELIAEQYQAFLESRDEEEEPESDFEEHPGEIIRPDSQPQETSCPETFLLEPTRFDPSQISSRARSQSQPQPRSQLRSRSQPRETLIESPGPAEPDNLSPASDGTLVAFEEDAIYFKPVSFSSPEPSPPPHRQSFEKPLPRTPSDAGTQPLQTCISMLVKELTTSMPRQTASSDTSRALQISVMIEAYENLRNNLDHMGMGDAEQRNVRGMFDCWLAALHTMHRSASKSAPVHERHYEGLVEDVD